MSIGARLHGTRTQVGKCAGLMRFEEASVGRCACMLPCFSLQDGEAAFVSHTICCANVSAKSSQSKEVLLCRSRVSLSLSLSSRICDTPFRELSNALFDASREEANSGNTHS